METLISVNKTIKAVLGKQKIDNTCKYRKFSYIIFDDHQDVVIAHNLLTKELLLLTHEEYSILDKAGFYRENIKYFIENWFLVPENHEDFLLQTQIKTLLNGFNLKKHKDLFYIFTTTDCNARCYYCFETGCKKINMSQQTAKDVAEYIIKECKGNPVNITWFGGEPLYNLSAIDIIVDKLLKANIDFESSITTNGFLFNKETVKKAKEKWNIKSAQITLDGTEKNYNKIKRYIYENVNAFQIVIDNISNLLKNDIEVIVRYNLDTYNEKDLYLLTDYLKEKFGQYPNFYIYVQIILEHDCLNFTRSREQNIKLYAMRESMLNHLENLQLLSTSSLSPKISSNRCMADSDSATSILPDGRLGKCPSYTYEGSYGSIYDLYVDKNLLKEYKKRKPVLDCCKTCCYYPNCIELEKCPSKGIVYCDNLEKDFKINALKRSMRKAYSLYIHPKN